MKKNAFESFTFATRNGLATFDRPAVMGILNITDDSFYDGGRYRQPDAMLAHARQLLADGADIIDVGASSSRPGATLLPQDIEAQRLSEAIRLLRAELPDAIISADTCFALPARAAIDAGADIINDIGGGDTDSQLFAAVADMQVPYILMHGGKEHLEHRTIDCPDPVDTLTKFFSQRLDQLYRLGIKDIFIDPGFGFGKTLEQNHLLLDRLDELTTLFRQPLLAALSRKRMVYTPLGVTPDQALHGTIALDAIALDRGARLLRVHDPRPALETIKLLTLTHTTNPPRQFK